MRMVKQFNEIINELNSGKPIIEILAMPLAYDGKIHASDHFRLCDNGKNDFGEEVYITAPDPHDLDGKYTICRSGIAITGGSEYSRILDRAHYMASTQTIHDGDEVVIVEKRKWEEDGEQKEGLSSGSAPFASPTTLLSLKPDTSSNHCMTRTRQRPNHLGGVAISDYTGR